MVTPNLEKTHLMNEDRLERITGVKTNIHYLLQVTFWPPSFLCESIRTLTARCGKICCVSQIVADPDACLVSSTENEAV